MYKSVSAYNLKGAYALGTALGGDGGGGGLQKSYTVGNCVVEKKRGFKPSDRHDPVKKQFLTELSKQIWQKTDESSNVSKKVDLHKIFTPATDAEEILPKNRKLYASSAFYSPTLHPTVEDQVELARRISHSLSDISNQKSKGQSMYVNRKKRSVKWVHEGSGQDYHQYQPKPPTSPSLVPAYSDAGKHRVQLNMHQEQLLEKYAKPGLKVVKTPWEAALETGSASAAFVEEPKLSPHHTPTPTLSPAPAPQYHDMKRGGSPYVGAAPTVTDGGVGGAYSGYSAPTLQQKPPQAQFPASKPISIGSNYQRDLAYKPSLPQGWKAPSMSLPKECQQRVAQDAESAQQHLLQQQYISEAVQSCERAHCKDEDEEVSSYSKQQACLLPHSPHEFVNHLIRSPELRVSPIPAKHLLLYDNAVQELQVAWEKQQQQQTVAETAAAAHAQAAHDEQEPHKRVDVRKQLQEFEQYQQQLREQQAQEALLLRQREARQRQQQQQKQKQQTSKQQPQQQQQQQQQQTETAALSSEQQPEQEQEQQEAEYVKVAVRELISSFEQQTLAEAEELAREQQFQLQLKRQQQKYEQKPKEEQQRVAAAEAEQPATVFEAQAATKTQVQQSYSALQQPAAEGKRENTTCYVLKSIPYHHPARTQKKIRLTC